MRWKRFLTAGLAILVGSSLLGGHALASDSAAALSTDGTEIAFDVYGQGEVALVFVHGFSCNRTQWNEQLDEFDDEYTIVTIDLAGHGESSDERTDWTFSNFAHDVRAVVNELGLERMVLIGHSMGGPVTAAAATLMEDRVIGIVPVDAFQNVEMDYPEGTVEAIAGQIRADIDTFMAGFVGGMLNSGIDQTLRARLVADSQNNDAGVMGDIFEGFGNVSQAQILANCPVPVHAINAPMFPTNLEGNRKHNESFEVTIVAGSGHWVMVEKPEDFNNALRAVLDGLLNPE